MPRYPGVVKAIEPFGPTVAIRIESDGKMEKDPGVVPPEVHDLDEFLQAVRDSGIVGLGGAAFPLWAKLTRFCPHAHKDRAYKRARSASPYHQRQQNHDRAQRPDCKGRGPAEEISPQRGVHHRH